MFDPSSPQLVGMGGSSADSSPLEGIELSGGGSLDPDAARHRFPSSSQVQMTELVLPRHTHPFGSEADSCSGGQIMAWMDTAAGIAAKRHCRQHVVTVSFDDLHFRAGARLGEVVIVDARVNKAFTTSMEVGIVVHGEHPINGSRRLLCSGYATFIAIDAHSRRPRPVPPLEPQTREERQASEQAIERRRIRLERKQEAKRVTVLPLAEVVEERVRGFHRRQLSFTESPSVEHGHAASEQPLRASTPLDSSFTLDQPEKNTNSPDTDHLSIPHLSDSVAPSFSSSSTPHSSSPPTNASASSASILISPTPSIRVNPIIESKISSSSSSNISSSSLSSSNISSSSSIIEPSPSPRFFSSKSNPRLADPLRCSRELPPFKMVAESRVEMTYVVQPSHANTIGITFGGQIMSWMETSATIAAMRHSRCQTTLVAVDDLHFNHPTKVGDVITIRSCITRVFHTSMEVMVTVEAENLLTGVRVPCNTGLMVFIALDAMKRPTNVIQVMPTLPEEIRQFREARIRRDRRLDRRAQFFELSTALTHSIASYSPQVSADLFREVETMRLDGTWETVSDDDGISISFSPTHYKSDLTAICCTVNIPATSHAILNFLLELKARHTWDVLWVSSKVLEILDERHDITHEVNAQGPFLSRDFCFLRAWKCDGVDVHNVMEHTPCVLAYQSMTHPKAACRKTHLRGEMPPSGYTILPLPPALFPSNTTFSIWSQLIWVAQCNYKALSLFVGDLIGRGNVIRASFQNLRRHFVNIHSNNN